MNKKEVKLIAEIFHDTRGNSEGLFNKEVPKLDGGVLCKKGSNLRVGCHLQATSLMLY
ncbi:MAG: hypothetical protein VW378_04850 [bacterium]